MRPALFRGQNRVELLRRLFHQIGDDNIVIPVCKLIFPVRCLHPLFNELRRGVAAAPQPPLQL